jgi:hypothetical protein
MGKESKEMRANLAYRRFMVVIRELKLIKFQEYIFAGERLFKTYMLGERLREVAWLLKLK